MFTKRLSALPLVVAFALAACGGSSDGATDQSDLDGPSSNASEASAAPAEPDDGSADAIETSAATDDVASSATGASSALLTLGGTDYVFDQFAQCLDFGERFMSVIARNSAGDELTVSYEAPDVEADGEGSEYANTVDFEPADGNSSWRAGSVTGALPVEYGALDWTRNDSTITGTATFENIYAQDTTDTGSFSVTCVE